MSLLRDIQQAAVDSDTDITELLRKCKILAARLGNEEFKQWVDNELNGYSTDDSLPQYRIFHVDSFGHFLGVLGMQQKNAPIPPSCLPENLRDWVSTVKAQEPISTFSSLMKKGERDDFIINWPAGQLI